MMRESVFTAHVISLARWLGWRVAHFRPAQTKKGWRTAVSGDGKGFPDLLMAHQQQKRVVFAELKAQRGALQKEQQVWRAVIEGAGAEYYLWKPSEIDMIEIVLRGKSAGASALSCFFPRLTTKA